ncbi:MAG: hypothetical protein H6817_03930 [Phycisphaerales bacterium]|nr:hypothetical protein [Phycisphaerales bacterium]
MRRFALGVIPAVLVGGLLVSACSKDQPPPPPTPSSAPLAKAPTSVPQQMSGELPPGHPPIDGMPSAQGKAPNDDIHSGMNQGMGQGMGQMSAMPPKDEDRTILDSAPTEFAGLSLTPPEGWKAYDASGGPMAPVAAFVLAKADGDSADGIARLTHFPGMKSIPLEMNLERWYRQVQQPDGSNTKDVAKMETIDAGGAKITVVDMSGNISGAEKQRMIAAVIEHPNGPHFLKVVGPEATMAKWHDSIIEYLKSAKVGQ